MKFVTAAGNNPIDRMNIVGRPIDRVDGPQKTTGRAPYAYERHDVAPEAAYGYVVGAAIAKGTIRSIDLGAARMAPGVRAIVTYQNAGPLALGKFNIARLLGGPAIEHYHQAVAVVVADTFEQARAGAGLIRIDYIREKGRFDLHEQRTTAGFSDNDGKPGAPARVGDFEKAYADAAVTLDVAYTTPDESHAMMEPFATTARWDGDELTLWTSNQMIAWGKGDVARTLGIPPEKVRLISPFIGGGFGGKLFLRADAILAALAAREAQRPVKLTLQRPLMMNNATHRSATIQRIRLGADRDGKLLAIAHESVSGNLPGGAPETAVNQTKMLYAGANRLTSMRLAMLDLPEANAMRAPGEAPGLMALEIAMDEMAEKLDLDPIDFRIRNDTQVDPAKPERHFSQRHLIRCLTEGAERFGWKARSARPGQIRDGNQLVGMGVAVGFRDNPLVSSAARVRLERDGRITVETDMTDIGTGSYTIIAQTAAEMMGVGVDQVNVRLGDSNFPVSAGSGGQWGANNATSGVYAACIKLRDAVAQRLGLSGNLDFADGKIIAADRSMLLSEAARAGPLTAEDGIEYGDLDKTYQQSTFAAHFVEVGVDSYTGEVRLRRMLAVCAAGRILNPLTARSQVIGAMTMGVGATLMEELAVDRRFGFFVNHDLAGYEVPVHADIPHQDVVFIEEADALSSPMKAKGVGELGLCGVGAAIANATYNATGIRVRDYPITLDKHLGRLPTMA